MLKALEALANGEVDACVSSGNTGALLGLARYSCGTMFENKDVAICAELLNPNRITLLLDVGAKILIQHLCNYIIFQRWGLFYIDVYLKKIDEE